MWNATRAGGRSLKRKSQPENSVALDLSGQTDELSLSIELTGCIWFHLIFLFFGFLYSENGVGRQHSSKLTSIPKGWSNSTVHPFCVTPVDICVKSLTTWSNSTVLKNSNDQFCWQETNFCLLVLTEYLHIVVSTLNACFKHC